MANHNGKHSFTTMMQYLSFYIFLNINFLLTYVIALNSYSFPFSDDRPLPTRVSSSEVGATALPQTERVESQQSTYNSPLYCEDDDVVIQSLDMTRLSIGKELFYTHSIHTFFTLCFYSLYVFCVYFTTPSMC